MELKYRNQLATTTDRIDAQTMLYQSLVNLGLAKADAAIAYYQLLRSAGMLSQQL
jgi:outer membrane protein TolC